METRPAALATHHAGKLEPSMQSFLVLFDAIIQLNLNCLCQGFALPGASCTCLASPGDGTVACRITGSLGPFKSQGMFKGLEAMDTCHQLTRELS